MKDWDKKKALAQYKSLDPRSHSDLAYWEAKTFFSSFSAGTPISLNENGHERLYKLPAGVAELMKEVERWLYTNEHKDDSVEDFVKALEDFRRKYFISGESILRDSETQQLYNTPIRTSISASDIDIISEIGAEDDGQFGKVFRGRYQKNTDVAIKQANSDSNTKQEFNIAGQFNSPYLVYCFGIYSTLSTSKIVFELMPQGSLESHLNRTDHFNDWSDIKRLWASDIIHGMAYLHGLNFAHRDLKAANILVSSEWRLKLADFGCSESISKTCIASGTPRYAAPEILPLLNKSVKVKPTLSEDIFSYAALLAQLISPVVFSREAKEGCFATFTLDLKNALVKPCPEEFMKRIAESCWATAPKERPTANAIVEIFEKNTSPVPAPKSAPPLGIS